MRRLLLVVVFVAASACGGGARRPTPPAPTTTTSTTIDADLAGPVAQAGCPPPPQPVHPTPPPWHPAVLVPDTALPPAAAPPPWTSHLDAIDGKGMWIWEWDQTDGGNPDAIVHQAFANGLHQLWIRVGDSRSGFYGAPELSALVDRAHAAGVAVIAWGFPYLYDPVGDAGWTAAILAWRSPKGAPVDGFSADLETSGEGVDMSGQRAAVYLAGVRRAAGSRLVVATVFPPLDSQWFGSYPYTAMAPYIDAYAPMEYWECADLGDDAIVALQRLGPLRPVHLIGQAFDMAGTGRIDAPSPDEIRRFLEVGRTRGAVGASFWVWQTATAAEWAALGAVRW